MNPKQTVTLALARRLREAASGQGPFDLLSNDDYKAMDNASPITPGPHGAFVKTVAGDKWFRESMELLFVSKLLQDEAEQNLPRVTQEQVDLMREIVRDAIPEVVANTRCYRQTNGIKFWCVNWHLMSCENIISKVQAAFLRRAPMLEVKVYAGSKGEFEAPCVFVVDKYSKPLKLTPWREPSKQPKMKTDDLMAMVFPLKGKPLNVALPITTLRKWKQTLDQLDGATHYTHKGEVRAITAEMQQLLVSNGG